MLDNAVLCVRACACAVRVRACVRAGARQSACVRAWERARDFALRMTDEGVCVGAGAGLVMCACVQRVCLCVCVCVCVCE